MADDTIRMGQVVGVFGPGAMLDLPERSVVVGGLDRWDMRARRVPRRSRSRASPGFCSSGFPETRARRRSTTRAAHAADGPRRPASSAPAIEATVFPTGSSATPSTATAGRRRLVRFADLEASERGRSTSATTASGAAHRRSVSSAAAPRATSRTSSGGASSHWPDGADLPRADVARETGTSADPRDTRVVCDCGSVADARGAVPAGSARALSRRAALDRRPRPGGSASAPKGFAC